jgi:hypothetical protein
MKTCSPQRQQIAKRSPAMHRDGKIISFGIAKNLLHAQWREISSNLSVKKPDLIRN